MKVILRLFFILLCGFSGAIFSYGITWGIGALLGPLYNSEADMTRNFNIFLIATFIMILAGCLVGNFLYKKVIQKK